MSKPWLLACIVCLLTTAAEEASGSTLFRLFLTDGSTVVSYGEFAKLDDRVIFSMPVGGTPDEPRLIVVTLPTSRVDWVRTDQYSIAARAQWYADTHGEDEFQQLSSDVARVLNEVAFLPDRRRGLEIAENARKALADWPRAHFGYRQADVREIVALLDEAISELRASLGGSSFDFALVATAVADAPLEPLLPAPTAGEQVAQVFRVAALTERAVDRVGLLQAALTLLGEAGPTIPEAQARRWQQDARTQIRREAVLDAAYTDFTRRVVASTTKSAAAADIPAVERALDDLRTEDERLGRGRPEAVDAVRAFVRSQLEAAQGLRLRRDQWVVRRGLYNDYQRSTGPQLRKLAKLQPSLEAIRRLDGPSPGTLQSLRKLLIGGADRLQRIGLGVPGDLQESHELFVSAWRFAERAVTSRAAAVSSGDLTTAWEASSAAAGALLMLSRAQSELSELVEPPKLQ